MATNTLYPIFTDKQVELVSPNKCKLKKLLLVARHGTRYPEEDDVKKFKELEKVFKSATGQDKYKWKNRFHKSDNSLLYTRGQQEHYLLGVRSFKKYRKFWKKIIPYDPNVIEFRSTKISRTGMSGSSYSIGLFDGHGILGRGDSQPIFMFTTPLAEDYELAIHLTCPLWIKKVDKGEALEEQVKQFTSKNLTEITDRISKKYNVKNLKPNQAESIYKACAFDIIFFNEYNSWCKLLNRKDIATLEYFNDMKHYYRFAYGNSLNRGFACKLISTLVNNVDEYLKGNSTIKAELFFAHSETISFLYTVLGLYEESEPLTANATLDEVSNRKYRTSEICPFATNVYFEIYTCTDEKSTLVQIVVNENPVVIPGCKGTYCEWSKFKELLGEKLNCDYEKVCGIKE